MSFRPLSGIVFSISVHNLIFPIFAQPVSVPSRGLCFQSNYEENVLCASRRKSFRPLSGIVFSIYWDGQVNGFGGRRMFPSPLGDCVFNLKLSD